MIRRIAYLVLCAAIMYSCNTAAKKEPVTNVEVATTFIRAVLDNDFNTAEKYLLKDETNQQYFETFKHQYQSKAKNELLQYKESQILIGTLTEVNDSTTLVNYSNTYEKNKKNDLKLLRSNNLWLVDLKYTFAPNQ